MLKNKYSKWYKNLITKARKRVPIEGEYYESHHCLPKSLGGSNSKRNLVKLTAKEHYISHLLLTKCFKDIRSRAKMLRAVLCLSGRQTEGNYKGTKYKVNSRIYEYLKKQYSLSIRGKNHHNYGKKGLLSPEGRARIIEASKNKIMSKEARKRIGDRHRGRVHGKEQRKRMSAGQKGKKYSEETRRKQSIRQKKEYAKGLRTSHFAIYKKTKAHKAKLRKICQGRTGKNHPTYGKRKYKLTFKSGKILIVQALTEFCKNSKYTKPCLYAVKNGLRPQHKGIIKVERLYNDK